MIEYKKGDILKSDAEALVNTVNTVGVMGKGIALAFKKAFPDNFLTYKKACETGELVTGKLLVTRTNQLLPKFIVNFPTKQHWRSKSKLAYIERGMEQLVHSIIENKISSIAIPPLGCGNGGLKWSDVKPVILSYLKNLPVDVTVMIYEPGFNDQSIPAKRTIALTPARAMLLSALADYKVLDSSINLLVAQKIAYFIQRFGEPLRLNYEKGHYGPYAHNLQHLLKYLNGTFLQFAHQDIAPDTLIELKEIEQVNSYREENLTALQKQRLEDVAQLIEGFESPFGLELLGTVDFLVRHENIQDTEAIIEKIGSWTNRKRKLMKPFHVKTTHNRLKEFYDMNKLVLKNS